jgi:hypothetical protein
MQITCGVTVAPPVPFPQSTVMLQTLALVRKLREM